MYRKIVGTMYILNILFQSLFNLASPILLLLGLAWLLVAKCSAPTWLYAVLGVVGALWGLVSVKKGEVSLVCTTFEFADEIDVNRAKAAKENAKRALSEATDKTAEARLKAKLARAHSHINVWELNK